MQQASRVMNHGLVITVNVEYDMGEPFLRDNIPLAVWAAEAARDLNNRIVARQREAAAQRKAEERQRLIEEATQRRIEADRRYAAKLAAEAPLKKAKGKKK